jgi:predicted nucleotidyltransferase
MINPEQIDIIKSAIEPLKPSLIAIFGSYARNEANQESDLDILIDFSTAVNLLQLIDLEEYLSEKLKIKVDLVTYRSVHPALLPYIQAEMIPLK